jgi:signal peptidase II
VHRLRQGRPRSSTLTARGPVIALSVAAGVVAIDQTSKAWMLRHQSPGPHHLVGPLGVEVGRNSGVAFSLISGHSTIAFIVTLALTVIVTVCALRIAPVLPAVVFGLLLGGGVSNDVDRVARHASGGVVDFLTLPHWPTFNLADAAITVGVAVLVVLLLTRHQLFVQATS